MAESTMMHFGQWADLLVHSQSRPKKCGQLKPAWRIAYSLFPLFFLLSSPSTQALSTSETARFLGQVADGFVCVLSLIFDHHHTHCLPGFGHLTVFF